MQPSSWSLKHAILVIAALVETGLVLGIAYVVLTRGRFVDGDPTLFGMPSGLVILLLAAGTAACGIIWLARVLRPLEDEPPKWRHRDRR